MRAFVMSGRDTGSVEEMPEPEVGDYDALVDILVCGVCSSTDKMLRRGTFRPGVTYPSILGHESVGRVRSVGDKVRAFEVGDLITRPSAYRPDAAPIAQYWGGFAERGVVTDWRARELDGAVGALAPRRDQVRLPGSVRPDSAALAISLSETYSVIARHDLVGKRVGVVGTGIAGLSFTQFAAELGAAEVLTVGRRDERVRLARDLGATRTALGAGARAAVDELGGLDIVFEASGQVSMVAEAYGWVRSGGVAVVYSAPDVDVSIDLFSGPREVSLIVAHPQEALVLPRVVERLEAGTIDGDFYVTHRYDLSDIQRAFDDIDHHGDVVKALVRTSA